MFSRRFSGDRSSADLGISMMAASSSVDDMLLALVDSGMPPNQAKAVTTAAQEFLVQSPGFAERAQEIMLRAGFNKDEADTLLDNLKQVIVEQQAA